MQYGYLAGYRLQWPRNELAVEEQQTPIIIRFFVHLFFQQLCNFYVFFFASIGGLQYAIAFLLRRYYIIDCAVSIHYLYIVYMILK